MVLFALLSPCGATMIDAEGNRQCKSCRACYSKDISVIAYQAHGKMMAKVVRLITVGA